MGEFIVADFRGEVQHGNLSRTSRVGVSVGRREGPEDGGHAGGGVWRGMAFGIVGGGGGGGRRVFVAVGASAGGGGRGGEGARGEEGEGAGGSGLEAGGEEGWSLLLLLLL
jgi:hypothetical protein